MQTKSQVALEFLTVYAWAFIVIAVTIGALYYFGFFDFGKYLPQSCNFPSQFKCLDFSLKPNEIRIKLANNLGEDIKVDSIQITNDATPPMSCSTIVPTPRFDWARGTDKDLIFNGCAGGGYIADERVELKVTMGYFAVNTPSKPIHIVNGKVNGRVTSS